MLRTSAERLKRIQIALGLEPDGVLGPKTLDAIEKSLRIHDNLNQLTPQNPSDTAALSGSKLTLSSSGIDKIIAHEIGSEAYYNRALKKPIYPGGASGVTIGIGYDLGYVDKEKFRRDWEEHLSRRDCRRLAKTVGLRRDRAKRAVRRLSGIKISFASAKDVFVETSLPEYSAKAHKLYPGLEKLEPDAQVSIVSLVYNRGTSVNGESRREMLNLKALVQNQDYEGIAEEILRMKRLWENKGLDGLLRRRDDEAELVRNARRDYSQSELVVV